MAWGDNVVPGATGGTYDIQDIAPTLLHLLGVPVAADMDGKVMDGLFKRRQPHVTIANYTALPESHTPGAQKKSNEALEKKLRSLGYLR
jgi:hypothetical protein